MAAFSSPTEQSVYQGQDIDYYGQAIREVGSGAFGTVYLTDKNYIIKSSEQTPTQGVSSETLAELSFVGKLTSPLIIKYLDVYNHLRYLDIVMDLKEGDLITMLDERNLSFEDLRDISYQLVVGLAHISSKNIIHRDIKPANALFQYKNGRFEIQYSDFGSATGLSCITKKHDEPAFTPGYVAPEIINNGEQTEKVDVWSLGCTIYSLFAGGVLFGLSANPSDLRKDYLSTIDYVNEYGLLPDITDPELNDLLLKMINYDPNERSSIYDLQQHPFFASLTNRLLEVPKPACGDILKVLDPKINYYNLIQAISDRFSFIDNFQTIVFDYIGSNKESILDLRTFILAKAIFDQFSNINPDLIETDIFTIRLVYYVSLALAVKAADPDKLVSFNYSGSKEMIEMEQNILNDLQYQLYFTVPIDYLREMEKRPAQLRFSERIMLLLTVFPELYFDQNQYRPDLSALIIGFTNFVFEGSTLSSFGQKILRAISDLYEFDPVTTTFFLFSGFSIEQKAKIKEKFNY